MKIRQFFLDILFPKFCLGCKAEGTYFCEKCQSAIPAYPTQFCPTCRKPSSYGRFCSRTCQGDSSLDGIIVASLYDKEGLLKKVIERFKYQFSKDLAEKLGKFLVVQFEQHFLSPQTQTTLVPVPLHKKRLKFRGFNQAVLLAKEIQKTNLIPVANILIRTINTQAQAKLTREERLTNVKNAFSLKKESKPQLTNKRVILIDDVCTTGATLNACAATLKSSGVKEVFGLVLARGA